MRKSNAATSKLKPASKARASWSTDDVYRLLNDVNRITLKRMEEENETTLARIVQDITDLRNVVATISIDMGGLYRQEIPRLEGHLSAIKRKVEA